MNSGMRACFKKYPSDDEKYEILHIHPFANTFNLLEIYLSTCNKHRTILLICFKTNKWRTRATIKNYVRT